MLSDEVDDEKSLSFYEMGLDDRILKAIAKLGWKAPTLIQEKGIPFALQGRDLLARARTGSGKTGAYAIPIIDSILRSKQSSPEQCIKALILAPTKELCEQVARNIAELCGSCSREVRCVNVSTHANFEAQKHLLQDLPDIVVGTPSGVLKHVEAGHLNLKTSVEMVVIDEADLVFAFKHEPDMRALLVHLPRIKQTFLMSATLSEDVKSLKKMYLHNPVTLKLEEAQLPASNQLTQCKLKCEEEDKFLVMYTLIYLKLLQGKILLFVNTVDRCYRLKLFLAQFSIPACVLNSELPAASRCHIVNQFNNGLYDIIIAADEMALEDPTKVKHQQGKSTGEEKKDKESGVSRGIDFKDVTNVVNFDFPFDVNSYIHRVGRTARGDNEGTALSLVSVSELPRLEAVEKYLASTAPAPADGGEIIRPFVFSWDAVTGIRYRAQDAMRSVTRYAIREARLKEIKSEILNSKTLSTYFEDNPRDLQVLRHDKCLHAAKIQPHLKNVPDYLVPPALLHLRGVRGDNRRNGSRVSKGGKGQWNKNWVPKGQYKHQRKMADPLKSVKMASAAKKYGRDKEKY